MIDPRQVIQGKTVEELSLTADEYFKHLQDPTPWMVKPFYSLVEAPALLQNTGLLLSGLNLGKTMTVLDFGAGSCWFSRILCQLQCNTISCDVSNVALEIGRRLFRDLPPLGPSVGQPCFLPFDGSHIDLPDGSVDRIVCNDAFHHVPNQEQILREFGRILTPEGIAGFSEPGKHHATTSQSQMEMRNYGVLENNIDLDEIFALARVGGFTRLSCKLLCKMELTLSDYRAIVDSHGDRFQDPFEGSPLERAALANIRQTMTDQTIFFLYKGDNPGDSRSHLGLHHTIDLNRSEFEVALGEAVKVDVTVNNVGTAKWLSANVRGVGVVNVGIQLYDMTGRLLDLNFARQNLGRDVAANETVQVTASIVLKEKGTFKLAVDLVSEGVCWFETLGCRPKHITVVVR